MSPSKIMLLAALLWSSWAVPAAVADPLLVNIDNPSFRKLVAAIPDLKTPDSAAGDQDLRQAAAEGPQELARLLRFSGLFNVLNGTEIGAESVTTGELRRDGQLLTVRLTTTDQIAGKVVLAKEYSHFTRAQLHKVMARYADRLLTAYTGKPGIFSCKLLFVGRRSRGDAKQVYVADFDGANPVALTHGHGRPVLPAFSHSGKYVTYTSYESGNPDLYLVDLATGKRRKIAARHGLNTGSHWSADDRYIAFSGSENGNTSLYLTTPDGAPPRPLLADGDIAVESAFSPDGNALAYVSRRYGQPHIFAAPLTHGAGGRPQALEAKRLTYQGPLNLSPSWSPDSKRLAYSAFDRAVDRFDLFTMNGDGSGLERLTLHVGDNKQPSWSANGHLLIFQSNRTARPDAKGEMQLYVMNRDGSDQRPLDLGFFSAEAPTWGPPSD